MICETLDAVAPQGYCAVAPTVTQGEGDGIHHHIFALPRMRSDLRIR